jgi:hypothetical protein
MLKGLLGGLQDLLGPERLRHILIGPRPHGLYRRGNAAVGRHHHHLDLRGPSSKVLEEGHAIQVGEPDVQDGQVEFRRLGLLQGLPPRPGHLHAVSLPLEELGEEVEEVLLVIDEEDAFPKAALSRHRVVPLPPRAGGPQSGSPPRAG